MSHKALLFFSGLLLCIACGENTDLSETDVCDSATEANCGNAAESTTIDSANSGSSSESDTSSDASNSSEPVEEVVRLLPLSCFIGASACDPRTGAGCGGGETCDFSSESQLSCFPPPNTSAIDEACNNSGGPYCASGGWCAPHDVTGDALCHQVCCTDSDCSTPGTECAGIFTDPNIGSLGLCKFASEDGESDDSTNCLPPGASCSTTNDQCCGYCHSGIVTSRLSSVEPTCLFLDLELKTQGQWCYQL